MRLIFKRVKMMHNALPESRSSIESRKRSVSRIAQPGPGARAALNCITTFILKKIASCKRKYYPCLHPPPPVTPTHIRIQKITLHTNAHTNTGLLLRLELFVQHASIRNSISGVTWDTHGVTELNLFQTKELAELALWNRLGSSQRV